MAQIAKAAGTENQVVGKVFILNGTVKAVSPDGTVRVLAPNSPVYANERIITESDGSVSIQFDGPPVTQMDLGRMTEVLVDQDVYAGVTPEVVSEAAAQAEQVQQSLLQGDQPIDLEATAAGGATGAGGGHPVVNFALDGNEGDIKSGAGTTGIDSTTVGTLGSVFAPAADGTPAGGMTVAATMDDEGLHGGIPGGDGDAPGELITTSGILPHDFGTDGAGSIGFASMDGATGELGVEEVSYSWNADTNTLTASSEERGEIFTVVVDPATGSYTLQLLQNVLHEPGQGENDATANLTYTVTDADGDTATGTLTINIDDDTPVLLGSGADSEGSTGGNGFVPTYEGIPGPGEGGNALVTGLGGDHGFGESFLPANDDGSTGFIDVSAIFPGGMKLFGQTYNGFYINNNGNITFAEPMGTFTPFAITGVSDNPMIAPFFADVDTRGAEGNVSDGGTSTGSNLVWYDFDQANGVITITWDDVGYYGSHTDHVNAFQLRIFNQGDQNFSFEFRYENLDWTTGDASGGSGGLGGTIARAGWTAGDGVNYYELPQSGNQGDMLALETTSNPDTAQDGNWVFNVVGGEITIGGGSDTVTVEDEELNPATDEAAGVAGDPTPDYTDTATGTIVDNVNWGADGFGSATEFKVGDATFETGTTVYWGQHGEFLGTNVGEDSEQSAASLLVNSDGTYTYNLLDNMLLGQDVQGEQIDVLSAVSITGVDGDGDPISVPLILNVQDDIPVLLTTEGEDGPLYSSDTVTVEDEKMQGWLGRLATDEHDGGVDHVTGTIVDNVNWGADGFDSVTTFSVDGQTFDVGTMVYWGQHGEFLGTNVGEDSEQPAASLLVNSDGTYTYNLLDNMLLGQGEQGEQIDLLATVSITGQDGDGDTQAVIVNLQVQDDMPLCITLPDIIVVEDEHLSPGTNEHEWPIDGVGHVTGTIVNNAAWGADGFGEATTFSVDGQTFDAGTMVYWSQNGTFLGTNVGEDSEQPAASMLVNSDGTYTYNLLDNMLLGQGTQGEQINLLDTVTITAQDADGDNVDVNVYLKVQDDKPGTMVAEANAIVEDEELHQATDEPNDATPDYTDHVSGDVSDNGNWGADGFGAVMQIQVDSHTAVLVPSDGSVKVYFAQDGSYQGTTSGDNTAANLLVNSDGTYTFTLTDNLLKSGSGEQIDTLGTVKFTGVDADGDKATVNLTLQVQDDVPTIDVGLADAPMDSLTTQDSETIDSDGVSVSDTDSGFFNNLFTLTSDMGADDGGTEPSLSYSLSVTDSATNLTSDGLAITVAKVGNDIVGSTSAGAIFSIGVNAGTGEVTLTQYAEIDHVGETADGDATNNSVYNLGLTTGNVMLTASATIVDGDGDSASDSQALDISGAFSFDDDVPTVSVNAAVMLDDDDVVGAGGNPGGPGDDAPANTTGVLGHDFGADGAGSVSFAAMNGQSGTVGTETVTYSWDAEDNALTAIGPRGPLFEVVVDPTTGVYTVTQLDNVLHDPPVADNITINTNNWAAMQDMVNITVGYMEEGAGMALSGDAHGAALITTGDVFGITSTKDGGDGGRFNEINHIDDSTNHESEVMIFTLQGEKTATHATVDITLFYKGEDMGENGPHPQHAAVVGNEQGSYALYNNGVQVQGPTTFMADSTAGTFTLSVTYAAGFDEIRLGAVQGTNDPQGEDSSDYNVKAITFDLMPEADENNAGPVALTYTVTDGDGDTATGTLNLTFDDDTPVAGSFSDQIQLEDYPDHITINAHNTDFVTGIGGTDDMVKITVGVTDGGTGEPHATLVNNGNAFGITSDVDGWNEIDYIDSGANAGKSEVMSFELQNDDGQAAEGMIATGATVDINVFFKHEDMGGATHGNEKGSYELYNNGHLVQGPTTFEANSTDGHFQLVIDPAGVFDEIRFTAIQGTNDPAGGDTSDYTVEQIKFDIMPASEGNLLTDGGGSFGADGGHILSIQGAGAADSSSSAALGDYDLQVTGKYGGTLKVDSNDGDYIYTPPANLPNGDKTETFEFTLIDGDGDTASAQLNMLIDDPDHHDGPC